MINLKSYFNPFFFFFIFKLQGMITRNFQGVICNEATLTQLLVLPPGFDVKRLASVICSVNAQNLTNELMAEFNIPNLIAAVSTSCLI